MSMTLQNFAANSSSTPVAKMKGGATTTGNSATGTGFTQTLTYAMNAGGTNAAGASAGAAEGQALSGLMGSAASLLEMLQALMSGEQGVSGEGQGDAKVQKVGKLLDDLLKKLQDMDASIMNDPTLVQALQSWLVQVQQVLGGGNQATEANGTADGATASLPALAQHADTLRFAVADAVSQIVEKMQAVQSGNQPADPKLEQLLNNLQSILHKAGGEGGSTSSGNNPNGQQSNNPAEIIVNNDSKSGEAGTAATASTAQASVDMAATTAADDQPPSGVVTAGQLAMRAQASMTSTPMQAPAATIPMQSFPSEMSKFIVNKFDIHQLGGLSEARIILNPEHLGQVDVKISIQDGQLLAQFITEKHGAKDALEQQMAQLRTALQAQGLQVDKLEVAQSSGAFSDMYHGGQGFESGAGQQQSGRRSKSKDEQSDDAMLTAEIGGELKEWRDDQRATGTPGVANMMNYGSTYVAKA
ncbi:flagellar hook-length control protein FliK [Paenibacillus campi]|uniref:flagellar hook-length control protein FliK n=1 Tax=Paenibacillus campi TaxID=3106031 RepID=UPI002AFF2853|nr:flagellar hook-length control protein FliK [Paenibacillus sp. SGZ-1009]